MSAEKINQSALERRWRLMLGSDADNLTLAPSDATLERTLGALYDKQEGRGGLQGSAPNVARWLGDIREYFPASVVQVMQKDAMERLGLQQMLLEPEMLRSVQPDVHLVATLLSLNRLMPSKTKETARQVVRAVVEQLERKLANPLRQAVSGSLNRAARNHRPRHNEIDWIRTIRANLRHYQAEYQTIIPERRIGFARKTQSLRDIVLCVDQSGSMAPSVVYASMFAAVLASIKAVSTQVVVFDTAVVDLTPLLADPVDVLFGTQLGGGTDIDRALAYCQGLVKRPQETIFVLISDLYEGGNAAQMLARAAALVESGVQMIALLALDDNGAPSYDHRHAAHFASLGIPCFACTPDKFPDLMAAAIKKQDLTAWAAQQEIVVAG
ncbi:Mg-chelatase subunit ChlD [Duganella sp. SG902]|uniref:VWA domain-containing protein n=1 Tax=Duganella sp. SG902 TaxID=2587016 RepID=UPI00159E06C7|nr:VWA domain-containing protein [Duganella sp. SG902]NVM75182.1 Mg-chelatase subunit ChlD [Duganella sp. SG902]